MACEEAGALPLSDSKHAIVYGVGDWGQVWKQGKMREAGKPACVAAASARRDPRRRWRGSGRLVLVDEGGEQLSAKSVELRRLLLECLEPPAEQQNKSVTSSGKRCRGNLSHDVFSVQAGSPSRLRRYQPFRCTHFHAWHVPWHAPNAESFQGA